MSGQAPLELERVVLMNAFATSMGYHLGTVAHVSGRKLVQILSPARGCSVGLLCCDDAVVQPEA
jgi:hypothetical protein